MTPKFCKICGAGVREYMECERPNCEIVDVNIFNESDNPNQPDAGPLHGCDGDGDT